MAPTETFHIVIFSPIMDNTIKLGYYKMNYSLICNI